MVKKVVEQGGVVVMLLGAAHDLTAAVRRLGGKVEYVRVRTSRLPYLVVRWRPRALLNEAEGGSGRDGLRPSFSAPAGPLLAGNWRGAVAPPAANAGGPTVRDEQELERLSGLARSLGL